MTFVGSLCLKECECLCKKGGEKQTDLSVHLSCASLAVAQLFFFFFFDCVFGCSNTTVMAVAQSQLVMHWWPSCVSLKEAGMRATDAA